MKPWRYCLVAAVVILFAGLQPVESAGREPAHPFDGYVQVPLFGDAAEAPLPVLGALGDRVDFMAALEDAGDYLQQMAADVTEDNAGNGTDGLDEDPDDPDDGGWDWRVTSPPAPFFHTTATSPTNIYGATAMGLYYAYLETGDAGHFTAMEDAADELITSRHTYRSAPDIIFLIRFNSLPEVSGTAYADSAKAKFDGRIAVYGTADSLAKYIRDVRYGQGYGNGIIAWDIGAWAVAAAMLEDEYPADAYDYATAADDIAEVIWQDSFNDNPGYFDIVDDAGWDPTYTDRNFYWYCLGLTGLIDAFRAADVHTSEIPGLVTRLLDSQFSNGAVSFSYGANPDDEDWQSTAYGATCLGALDQFTYQRAINKMGYYMGATQDASGGWRYSSGNHYPEVCGECASGLGFTSSDLAFAIVDDDFTSQADVDVYNAANGTDYVWGYDAFAAIGEGVDAVSAGGTVQVEDGTYEEQVEIAKDLTLDGAGKGSTIVQSPASLTEYFVTGSNNNYPVIYIHGAASVTVQELTVDGLSRGNSNYRFTGIGLHNAGGAIDNCEIKDIKDTPISGAQHGVGLYAYCPDSPARVLNVTDCDVYGYQKNGMAMIGDYLTANIDGCVVTGYGPAAFIAQNGIQIGPGATGSIGPSDGNTVSGHSYTPHTWAACGILVNMSSGTVVIENNTVTENSEGIYCWDASGNVAYNTVTTTQAGTGVADYWGIICDPGVGGALHEAQAYDGDLVTKGVNDPLATFTYDASSNVVDGDDGAGSVGLWIGGYGSSTVGFTGSSNQITDFDYGVYVDEATPGIVESAVMNYNAFMSNVTYGFYNNAGVTADALRNWWGDASGPSGAGGGSGDAVSTNVLFTPHIGYLGEPNVFCTPDPQELTNAEPVKTVDVDYVGGGGGLVYGYSLKFSWDGGVVSTAPVSVTEGSLLSDQGLTQFFALASGANEITVDCVLLGDQPGVTGPGTMFTIEFTGLACGVSDIDVTVIKVRDKANNSLGGFYEDDGEIIVDMVNPVFTINDPWPDGECYNVSPVLDLSASDACGDLHDAFYRIDGGAWASDAGLFTGYSGSAWSNSAWTLPGFGVLAEGPHTVEFYCDDDVGNPSAVVGWDFIKDTIDPSAVSDFDASPGHEKVHLSWTNPGGGPGDFDHVVVVRKPWSGGSPYGYPEYVQPADGYPAGPGDGAVVYSGTGSSYDDPVADRSIYFYRAFVYDCAGNYNGGTSPGGDIPPGFAQGDRSTNYWLGDMTDGVGFTGSYDGLVDFNDINGLSACYWLYSPGSPPGSPHNECDVGPTDDNSRLGLPVPDDYIDFEDLMIFAMNYGVVSPLGAPVLEREELGPVVLRLESTGAIDNELVVSLVLGGNVDEVKGVSVVLEYDTESLVLESATRSSGLAGGLVFFDAREGSSGEVWIDVAALGRGQVVRGSGELARLVFSVAGTSPEVKFAEAEIRGVDNRPLDAVSESYEAEVVPALTRLLGARPNPFGPGTTVQYELSRSEHVLVEVYDARGRLVRELVDGVLDAGSYSERWDGLDSRGTAVHGGVYFVKMRAGGYESTSKLVKLQ